MIATAIVRVEYVIEVEGDDIEDCKNKILDNALNPDYYIKTLNHDCFDLEIEDEGEVTKYKGKIQ